MAASGIFFDGLFVREPGSFTRVDFTALEQIGLGASGIVAVVGDAVGGRPVSAITETKDFIRITKPERARSTFRAGDLREAGSMIFDPSRDPDIGAGAQEMVAMKTNPATQSTLALSNGDGPAMTLTSEDYGAHTEQINYEQLPGTVTGKLINIRFEDTLESRDNVGGDPVFGLQYDEQTTLGWDTMTAEVLSSGIRANGARSEPGLDTDVTAGLASILSIVSTSGSDTGRIAVYGLVAAAPVREVVQLTGTTAVLTTNTFDAGSVFAAELLDAAAVGVMTVDDSFPTTLLTIAALAQSTGGVRALTMYVAAAGLSLVLGAAGTENVWLVGRNATGNTVVDRITMAGTTPVASTVTNFTEILFVVLGELPAASTVTISGAAVQTVNTTQNNLTKAADHFNGRQVVVGASTFGFTFTIKTGLTQLAIADLDLTAAPVNVDAVEGNFNADLFFIIDHINTSSQLITALRATGATGPATDTASPQFLAGGIEGVTTFTDIQKALDLLKLVRVNSIVLLSADPAAHAALEAHLRFRAGLGRSEADGFVGLLNTPGTALATKAEIKSQVLALNSRHVRAFAQSIDRFNTAGERTEFNPPFQGVIAAAMQAGSPVGTSLTHKIGNVLSIRQDSGWNPVDDSEELIAGGLCFMQDVDGIGRRFVRNITTHLSTSNIARTEASVNEAANFATFNFRTNMEIIVGRKGFAGTIVDAKSVALNTLSALVGEPNPVLVAFRNLEIELVLDVLEVSVEIAPVIPINFILTTVHLVSVTQTA